MKLNFFAARTQCDRDRNEDVPHCNKVSCALKVDKRPIREGENLANCDGVGKSADVTFGSPDVFRPENQELYNMKHG